MGRHAAGIQGPCKGCMGPTSTGCILLLGNGALEEVVGEMYRVQILGPQNSPVSWVCSCHLTEVLKMPASLHRKAPDGLEPAFPVQRL